MWSGGGGQDPGGASASGAPPSQELEDLKDQFEQQQVLISQLKEMLRKNEQPIISEERVEEFANKLSKMSARAKRGRTKKAEGSSQKSEAVGIPGSGRRVDTPAKEKINLLRQQMEENKAKLAERGKSQKGIEEMVIQLKAQLDDSQNLINQAPLNLSITESVKPENYSADSSSQELYKVLLLKEKVITDLTSKVQKLEANVLDLQENIKEKDQVIDARTKAITLMSENLSKKSKHTLDTLEETKEQMRKMQENFVQLEAEMQAEKHRLVGELLQKDVEITTLKEANIMLEKTRYDLMASNSELQEKIENLHDETTDHPEVDNNSQISELKAQLEKLQEENKSLQELDRNNKEEIQRLTLELQNPSHLRTQDVENEEISRLKKQLDESNKQMIKIKAQSKSKIKELNKKIETFKKVGDANAEIVRLEAENTKLEQKILLLSESKGKTDAGADKDVKGEAAFRELESKIEELKFQLVQKDAEIVSLKEHAEADNAEILTLKEELANLSHLQNTQVKSQLDSIAFEEQLDRVESEKRQLVRENEDLHAEINSLVQKVENLKKENQEVVSKMESYMHENMELIDKLEKLSAEKVSSAESIEIVEGLTQQEKLELEAYQKNLDLLGENLKVSEEAELNESVHQLTEDSSELLQKIELFTLERREVMEKMEALTHENSSLLTKLREIENNRDVLAETYEQLQSEKEKLEEENERLKEVASPEQVSPVSEEEVARFRAIAAENDELKIIIDRCAQEKSTYDKEIAELKSKLMDSEEELRNYQSILEENKSQLISSSNTINELYGKIEENEQQHNTEIEELKVAITSLKQTISELEEENVKLKDDNESLAVLQKQLEEKMEQMDDYEKELNENLTKMAELSEELKFLNIALAQTKEILQSKEEEITKKDALISSLEQELKTKDEKFHSTCKDLQEKYMALQSQLETNTGAIKDIQQPFEEKIEELVNRNKEQLEKMKKIAANLKKKTSAYQELEEKYAEVKEKWETESKEKEDLKAAMENQQLLVMESEKKMNSLLQQLHEVEDELTRVQNNFEAKSRDYDQLMDEFTHFKEDYLRKQAEMSQNAEILNQLSKYKADKDHLQNRIKEYEDQITSLVSENEQLRTQSSSETELVVKQQEIDQLKEQISEIQYSAETNSNALQAKIQELEMYVETQELQLTQYKERVYKLEEGLANVEERRLSLERTALELGMQLKEKSESFEEISHTEDMLEARLKTLEKHDKAMEKRLQEKIFENQQLLYANQELQEQNDELKHKVQVAHNKVSEMSEENEKLIELETENEHLKKNVNNVETQLKNLRLEFEQKLDEKKKEIETTETELQEQFQKLNEERKNLLEQVERLTDQISFYENEQEGLREEVSEYKEKMQFLQGDLHKLKIVNEELQNSSEDKQAVDEDLQKLRDLISQRDKEIEEYQRQNLQLQMQSTFAGSSVFDASVSPSDKENKHREEISEYQRKITDLEKQLEDLKLNLRSTAEVGPNPIVSAFEPKEQPAVINFTFAEEGAKEAANFTWPETNEDPFSFVTEKSSELQTEKETENKSEDLQKKIEALEMLLYNTEKEKQEAYLQCHHLSNELAQLVFEKEKLNTQILKNEDLADTPETRAELHNLEFAPVRADLFNQPASASAQPVTEEILTPKTAYLCFEDEPKPKVEDQIVKEINITPQEQQHLHDLEFEKTKTVPQPVQTMPVQEEKLHQEHAYVCYKPETSENAAINLEAFEENDDGWAWGPEEAKLEAEHRVQKENISENVASLTERIKALELEKEQHLEEIKQSQLKSAKLLKKLKEFKTKNEQLASQLSGQSSFGNLDDAIQDELKSQIGSLEKRIRETTAELEKEKAEKDNLKKRIDVLTSANERMVEMKEKQDVEAMLLQQKMRELSAQLHQFDWGDDGFDSPVKKPPSVPLETAETHDPEQLLRKIQELNETVKDLSLDNEELQSLLEEQRNLRLSEEKTKAVAPHQEQIQEEYQKILAEKNSLNEQLNLSNGEKKRLQDEINVLLKKNDSLLADFGVVINDKHQLEVLLAEKGKIIDDLNSNLNSLRSEYSNLVENKSTEETDALHRRIDALEEEKFILNNTSAEQIQDLNRRLSEKSDELVDFSNKVQTLTEEKEALYKELQEKTQQISTLNDSVNTQIAALKTELEEQRKTIESLTAENTKLTESIKQKDEEYQLKLSTTLEQISQEWSQRVDQRGSDVAESWKLHLESRENEFTQLEQLLRKEIYELEEKCNGLANENNELRKNVDAEIRNEVDRVAALQQQINDKQQSINELMTSLNQVRTQLQETSLKVTDLETTLVIKQEELDAKQQSINSLTEKLHNVESVETQVRELEGKANERDSYRNKVAELEETLENSNLSLNSVQQELELCKAMLEESQNLNITLQKRLEEKESVDSNLTLKLQDAEATINELQRQVFDYQQQVFHLQSLLEEKQRAIDELQAALQQSKSSYDMYTAEVTTSLTQQQEKYHSLNEEYQSSLQRLQNELETKTQEHQQQSFEHQTNLHKLQEELTLKSNENDSLRSRLEEQNALNEEENKQLSELRAIIEDQVLKIEELKKELFQKSNDYDALIAELDMHQQPEAELKQEKHQLAPSVSHDTEEDDLLEPVSRAELDLALYMLHQRDVRCEELTMELTQLLEERDTLQLRLSNALREKEELRNAISPDSSIVKDETERKGGGSTGTVPKSKAVLLSASGTELATEASESLSHGNPLDEKLTELKTVGYRKDKTIVDEQELRRLQQLSIMQQHRDEAAKLPPEAAARLVDATYTLSRDVQSPSKVLLNWLWGRSTPKVNDI